MSASFAPPAQRTLTPPAPSQGLAVADLITVTARLAQLLAEEVDLLKEMKVKDMERLQKEKIFLTNALEAQHRWLQKNPQALNLITPAQRTELAAVNKVFQEILRENHQRLLTAREVNGRIVQAIRSVADEHSGQRVYNQQGTMFTPGVKSLSITLNQSV